MLEFEFLLLLFWDINLNLLAANYSCEVVEKTHSIQLKFC